MELRPIPNAVLGALLALVVVAVFLPVLDNGFVNYDDGLYVTENPVVARGWTMEGVRWAFEGFHASNWHPLTWLSHMTDQELFGNDPRGHHATSLVLHAVTAALLFLALAAATGHRWTAWLGVAWFALHPLRVESVAWVAERKDVLSMALGAAAIGLYARYARRGARRDYLGMAALFALSLLAKPMLVTLPLLLLLLDGWPLERLARGEDRRRAVLEKVPLLALSVLVGIVTVLAQEGAAQAVPELSWGARVGHAAISTWHYLGDMAWPHGLAVLYLHPGRGPAAPIALLAVAGLAAITALTWHQRRQRPWLLVGWAWFLIALAPVIGLLQVGEQARADRYTYLPSVGIVLAVAWEIRSWVAGSRLGRRLVALLSVAGLAALSVTTRSQIGVWRDSETLFRHVLAVTGENPVAHSKLGEALQARGEPEAAITEYRRALALRPEMTTVRSNLGVALRTAGRLAEAKRELERAVADGPDLTGAHFALAMVLEEEGEPSEAVRQLVEVLALDPGFEPAWRGIAALVPERVGLARTLEIVEEVRAERPDSAVLEELRSRLRSIAGDGPPGG